MNRQQLMEIIHRHVEDHENSGVFKNPHHPRPLAWGHDAVGDRAVLIEFIIECASAKDAESIQKALGDIPGLKLPRLPDLRRPGLPHLKTR